MFKELNREFLTGFHAYIAKEAGYKKNTIWIYMIALKHILMLARSKGYMDKDIFANYKLQSEFVTRNYLTMDEINRMMQYENEDVTLQLVRDTFLFSCFTGLSYVDIRGLEPQNIQEINIFSGVPPDLYLVITPMVDTFALHADDSPGYDTQEARLSLFVKGSYTAIKDTLVRALLGADFCITDRRYIAHEDDTGFHHYAIDVAKLYQL